MREQQQSHLDMTLASDIHISEYIIRDESHASYYDEDLLSLDDESTEIEDATIAMDMYFDGESLQYGNSWGRWMFWGGVSMCFMVMMAVALIHIWAHSEARRLGALQVQGMAVMDKLQDQKKKLQSEIAAMREPVQLAKRAREKLHMIVPEGHQVIMKKQLDSNTNKPIRLAQRMRRKTYVR